MRRAPFVIGATGVGLGLLFSFHTKPIHASSISTSDGSGTSPSTGSGTGDTTTTTAGGGGTSPTTGGSAPTGGTTTPTTSSPPTTAATTRSATGQDIQYRYGYIQLKVTERGSTVTKIQVVQEGATDPRSEQINSQAIPMLQDQAMSAHSANIDGVSGATFTSIAYQEALQSALDQLG